MQHLLVVLLLMAADSGTAETGLSKGPANPAELGTRCAVIAGREDRAYLDCARQAPSGSTRTVVPPERSDVGRSGTERDGAARRYPARRR